MKAVSKRFCCLFQVCDIAETQGDNDENSSALIDRRASLVEAISDAGLESLKILSGGIAIMMVSAREQSCTGCMVARMSLVKLCWVCPSTPSVIA